MSGCPDKVIFMEKAGLHGSYQQKAELLLQASLKPKLEGVKGVRRSLSPAFSWAEELKANRKKMVYKASA